MITMDILGPSSQKCADIFIFSLRLIVQSKFMQKKYPFCFKFELLMVNSILAGSLTLKSRKVSSGHIKYFATHAGIVCDVMDTDLAKHKVAKWQSSHACFHDFQT